MACTYGSSCLGLPVLLVDCQVDVYLWWLHHMCQGEHESLKGVERDGPERKLCRVCVDGCGPDPEEVELGE